MSLLSACFELLGARLAPVPALSTLALALPWVRSVVPEPTALSWWSSVLEGRVVLALASVEVSRSARVGEGTWLVSGDAHNVVDGHSADVLLALVDLEGARSLVEIERSSPGFSSSAIPCLDLTRELAAIRLDDVAVRVLGQADVVADGSVSPLATGQVLLAAEMLGGISTCLRYALDHVRVRHQFGRSLGSFQAIKHRLADLYMDMELARSAVADAAHHLDACTTEAELSGLVALDTTAQTYVRVTEQTLQVLGGLGFTWEHPLHLFLKRARSSAALLSLPWQRQEQLYELLDI